MKAAYPQDPETLSLHGAPPMEKGGKGSPRDFPHLVTMRIWGGVAVIPTAGMSRIAIETPHPTGVKEKKAKAKAMAKVKAPEKGKAKVLTQEKAKVLRVNQGIGTLTSAMHVIMKKRSTTTHTTFVRIGNNQWQHTMAHRGPIRAQRTLLRVKAIT